MGVPWGLPWLSVVPAAQAPATGGRRGASSRVVAVFVFSAVALILATGSRLRAAELARCFDRRPGDTRLGPSAATGTSRSPWPGWSAVVGDPSVEFPADPRGASPPDQRRASHHSHFAVDLLTRHSTASPGVERQATLSLSSGCGSNTSSGNWGVIFPMTIQTGSRCCSVLALGWGGGLARTASGLLTAAYAIAMTGLVATFHPSADLYLNFSTALVAARESAGSSTVRGRDYSSSLVRAVGSCGYGMGRATLMEWTSRWPPRSACPTARGR